MPFEVETTTTVKWKPIDGRPDDSRFMIFRENGNMMPLIGTADWTDSYPNHRLCLVQECWPDHVLEAARLFLSRRSMSPEALPKVKAIILSELRVGAPSLRIELTSGRFSHGIIDEHTAVLEGKITGLSVID